MGGEMVEGKRASSDRVLVKHGPWSIWLDTYVVSTGQVTVTLTRVRAYFGGRRELQLKIRRRNFFDWIASALGRSRGPPQARALTDRYVVKVKPEARLSSLFSGTSLTEAILAVPSLGLVVRRPSRKSRKRYGEDAGVVNPPAGQLQACTALSSTARTTQVGSRSAERHHECEAIRPVSTLAGSRGKQRLHLNS